MFKNEGREEKYLIMTPLKVQSESACTIDPSSLTCTVTQDNERLIIEFLGAMTDINLVTVTLTNIVYPNTKHGKIVNYGRSNVLHGFYSSGNSRLVPKSLYSSEYTPSLSNSQACVNSKYEFTFYSLMSIVNSEITLTGTKSIDTNNVRSVSITDGTRSCLSNNVKISTTELKVTFTGCIGDIIGSNTKITIDSIRNDNKINEPFSFTGSIRCPNEDNNDRSECMTIKHNANFILTSGIFFFYFRCGRNWYRD
jgi:hypothetical protein